MNRIWKEHYKGEYIEGLENMFIESTTFGRRKQLVELRRFVNTLKAETPCWDCSGFYNPISMDFDHVRGIKKFNISQALIRGISKLELLEEMKKCEIVCSNCHRIRTKNRSNSKVLNVTKRIFEREYKQLELSF